MATSGGHRWGGRGRRPGGPRGPNSSGGRGSGSGLGPWWADGGCPDTETFAAFLERRLPAAHRERIIEHLAGCRSCRQAFATIVLALDHLEAFEGVEEEPAAAAVRAAPRVRTRLPSRTALLAASLTGLVCLSAGLLMGWWLPTRDPRALLTSIVPRERPFSARFTGGIPWSPHSQEKRYSRAYGDLNLPPGAVSYLAAAELRGKPSDAPNASELGAIGAAQLLGGRVDPGVETLTRAVAAEPESPELLSDLGAALLAREESSDRLDVEDEPGPGSENRDGDLPAALEAIDRALEKSPRLREALFNRALALERLYLRASARKAWQAYLAVDPRSPWAIEARQRLAAIEVPAIPDAVRLRAEIAAVASGGDQERLAALVQNQRHLARRTAQEDLLPGWGEAILAGNVAEAAGRLAAARAIAEEWEAQTTDPTLRMAVVEAESAAGRSRERLARGYRAFGESTRAFAAFDLVTTQAAAHRALEFLPNGSSAVSWAGVLRLACVYYASGNVALEAQELLSPPGSDFASRGAALWLVGLWRAKRGDHAQALATYRDALAAYGRVEEREPTVWLRHLIGEAYGYMGASGLSWQYRRAAMRDLATMTERKRVFPILLASAMVALAEQRPRAAADFLEEMLAVAGPSEPFQAVEAFLWRSRIRLALGDLKGANDDFVRASTWLPRITPADARWLTADWNLVRGMLTRDPNDAVGAFSKALDGFRASGELYRLPGVLLARAQAHLKAGRVGIADGDLRQAVVLHEQQQGTGFPQLLWTAPLDQPDRLFDERVSVALREGRADEAFAAAEAGRARALRLAGTRTVEMSPDPIVEPLRLADLRLRLEPGTTVLFLAVLQDRVVQWRVERERSSLVAIPVTPRELARTVAAFEADLKAGVWTAATRELAMRIYAALIQPAHLGTGPLVVIPDGELHGLPFAALIDPATRRFLIEDRTVTVAPSATAYISARDRWRAFGAAPPVDAFVVGDPRVSPDLFPGIRPLQGARGEARAIAALYPRRELLLGEAATRTAFVRMLGGHDVVHFAGHAVANRVNPDRSSLPLADDGSTTGSVLFGTDIAALNLSRTRTVVLSGCETAGGRLLDGEGPLSLARAFLAAGVPNVVASLWPIPDAPPARLVTAFHQRLRQGERPAAALRSAQLSLLRGGELGPDSPSVWASFQVFGGG